LGLQMYTFSLFQQMVDLKKAADHVPHADAIVLINAPPHETSCQTTGYLIERPTAGYNALQLIHEATSNAAVQRVAFILIQNFSFKTIVQLISCGYICNRSVSQKRINQ